MLMDMFILTSITMPWTDMRVPTLMLCIWFRLTKSGLKKALYCCISKWNWLLWNTCT